MILDCESNCHDIDTHLDTSNNCSQEVQLSNVARKDQDKLARAEEFKLYEAACVHLRIGPSPTTTNQVEEALEVRHLLCQLHCLHVADVTSELNLRMYHVNNSQSITSHEHRQVVLTMDPDQLDTHKKMLRDTARTAYDSRVSFKSITSEHHRQTLDRAIRNVLSTELAQFTYAQIVDGLPIADVAWDRRLPGIMGEHIIDDHETLCPGALEQAQVYYKEWDPSTLNFDPEVSHPTIFNDKDRLRYR